MSNEKTAIRITELDFLSIKENLKTFLRSQTEFQDFDFEGAGMNVLLDILALNTHYMSYYLNMVGNEMFLDSAQLRNSILSHAKLMNYVPGSSQGSMSKIDVRITPSSGEDQVSNIITLDKYTKLLGTDIDGVNYPFVTLYSNTASKDSGSFFFSNVAIKQGEVVTLQYQMTPTNTKRRFDIPSSNVDSKTIVIAVQESATNTDISLYTPYEDITELDANSKVYFLEENENLKYSFYFGDNVLGKRPKDGNIIICTYLDNVGSVSNSITGFTFTEPIGAFSDNVIVSNITSSYGGTDKEGIEQIRYRAPYYYTTQNRAVTKNDYETLILKDFNNIDSVSVWGGEDNDPVVYGKVFICLKPSGNYQLTNFEKERIKTELIEKRNVLTVTPEIVDPDYVYLLLKGTVNYNARLTTRTDGEILDLVKAAIADYSEDELNKFGSTFRKSKLQNYIENCEKSITGSDIDVYVQKRVLMDTTKTKSYTIQYKLPLKQLPHFNKLSTFPEIEVFDSGGVPRNVFIEEVPEAETGIDAITLLNAGQNYTSPPTVIIRGDGRGATATAEILSGRVSKINITNAGENYSTAAVTLSGGEGSGASAVAILQANIGTLRLFYYKDNGEKVIINSNIGTINYKTGEIVLNSLRTTNVVENDFYEDGYLSFDIQADNEIIPPLRNRILSIDGNNPKSIQISMVSE